MSVRISFVETFGEEQAKRIELAAEEHKNGVHDKPGSDYFKWALCICIGYRCMEKADYRKHHKITIPWIRLKAWIKECGQLASHDGDFDFICFFAGHYNEYIRPDSDPIKCFDCGIVATNYMSNKQGLKICVPCFEKRQSNSLAKEVDKFSND